MKLLLTFVLFVSLSCVLGQDSPDDPMDDVTGPNEICLRCICHARSGCFFLRNCANYSINRDYWIRAGRPTVLDDEAKDDSSFDRCKKNDGCIMRAIRGYLKSMPNRDCNCDLKVDCKDYAAIHLKGDQCRSSFDPTQLGRLDKCLKDNQQSYTPGWNTKCTLPDPQ